MLNFSFNWSQYFYKVLKFPFISTQHSEIWRIHENKIQKTPQKTTLFMLLSSNGWEVGKTVSELSYSLQSKTNILMGKNLVDSYTHEGKRRKNTKFRLTYMQTNLQQAWECRRMKNNLHVNVWHSSEKGIEETGDGNRERASEMGLQKKNPQNPTAKCPPNPKLSIWFKNGRISLWNWSYCCCALKFV